MCFFLFSSVVWVILSPVYPITCGLLDVKLLNFHIPSPLSVVFPLVCVKLINGECKKCLSTYPLTNSPLLHAILHCNIAARLAECTPLVACRWILLYFIYLPSYIWNDCLYIIYIFCVSGVVYLSILNNIYSNLYAFQHCLLGETHFLVGPLSLLTRLFVHGSLGVQNGTFLTRCSCKSNFHILSTLTKKM